MLRPKELKPDVVDIKPHRSQNWTHFGCPNKSLTGRPKIGSR